MVRGLLIVFCLQSSTALGVTMFGVTQNATNSTPVQSQEVTQPASVNSYQTQMESKAAMTKIKRTLKFVKPLRIGR